MSIGLGLNVGVALGATGVGRSDYAFNLALSSITGAVTMTLVTSAAGGVVDWGDGTTTALSSGTNSLSHTYSGYTSAAVSISKAQYIAQLTYTATTASLACTTAALPRGLTYLYVTGSNTLSGDVQLLPRGLTYLYVTGSNTLSGDVQLLPRGLTYLYVTGSNTLSGDVATLPSGLTYFIVAGSNTVSGDVATLPSGLTYLHVIGSNTLSGDVATLPSGLTSATVTGSNTLYGNVTAVPSGLITLYITGLSTLSAYTSRSWPTSMRQVYLTPVSPGGLSSTAVDQLLIDLAAYVTTWTIEKVVTLTGANAARTSASATAVTTLQGRGVTVTTN
jgi:hypothetical protein